MGKTIFQKDPLLGKDVSRFLKNESIRNVAKIMAVLEEYFTKKIYSKTNLFLHEYSPVCSLCILMNTGKKGEKQFMLSVEGGYLASVEGNYIEGNSNDELSDAFFKAFLDKGVSINFDSHLVFYNKNANPNAADKTMLNSRQSYHISFTLKYKSENESILSDLSRTKYHLWCTSKKTT